MYCMVYAVYGLHVMEIMFNVNLYIIMNVDNASHRLNTNLK
jgi:hypothetical protein